MAAATSASGGRFAAIATQTAPSAAQRAGVSVDVASRSASATRSSPVPCCQRAWLEIIQVLVPKANATASGKAHRPASRCSNRYTITTVIAASSDAESFSMMVATQSTCHGCQPCARR